MPHSSLSIHHHLPLLPSPNGPRSRRTAGQSARAKQIYFTFCFLGEEHDLIHQTRWGHVKVCYLACRYYPIIITPLYLWACIADIDPRTCANIVLPLQIFLLPLTLFPQFVILVRAYGFTGRNLYVLLLLCGCFVTLLFLQFWGFANQSLVARKVFAVLGTCQGYKTTSNDFSHTRHVGYVMVASIATDALALIVVSIVGYIDPNAREVSLTVAMSFFVTSALLPNKNDAGSPWSFVLAARYQRLPCDANAKHRLCIYLPWPGSLADVRRRLSPNVPQYHRMYPSPGLGPSNSHASLFLLLRPVVCTYPPLAAPQANSLIHCLSIGFRDDLYSILQLRRQVSPTETFQLRRQSQLVRDAVGVAHDPQPPDPGSGPPHISIPLEDYYLRPMPTAHQLLPQHNIYFHSYHPRDPPSFSIPKP
ncbi:hypothetical protein CCMSSC00406_0004418 [Pleurotus cornucopiae]|uniref:Uncharacterized protein n=1 Tax=Pleurotus cornucopiae TaxID=5321 RepID=A0ACB7J209_PLECO|nr:hypothetical protein CCMSSC00406_0004418 [Pleurotus cornucopiae]